MNTRQSIVTLAACGAFAFASAAEAQIAGPDGSYAPRASASSAYSAAALRVMRFHYQALVHYYRVHTDGIGPGTLGGSSPSVKALRPDDRSGGIWG